MALVNDIQKGTPVWLDAKYHEVFCLVKTKKKDDAKRAMSSVLISYPKLGAPDKPELEKKFLAMMKKNFSKKDYEELIQFRQASIDGKSVADDIKKKDQEALDALRPEHQKKDKKK